MHSRVVAQHASSLHFICFLSSWDEKKYSIFVHPLACFSSSVSQQIGTYLCDRAWSEAQWDLSNVFAFGSWICYYRRGVRAMPYSDFLPSHKNCLILTHSVVSKSALTLLHSVEAPPDSCHTIHFRGQTQPGKLWSQGVAFSPRTPGRAWVPGLGAQLSNGTKWIHFRLLHGAVQQLLPIARLGRQGLVALGIKMAVWITQHSLQCRCRCSCDT